MWKEIKDTPCIRFRTSLQTMKLPVAVISADNRNLSVCHWNAAHSPQPALRRNNSQRVETIDFVFSLITSDDRFVVSPPSG
jgi:hypothetical protein